MLYNLLLAIFSVLLTLNLAHSDTLENKNLYVITDDVFDNSQFLANPLSAYQYNNIESLPLTGGHFAITSNFNINESKQIVIDFKNTSAIASFTHHIYDDKNQLVAQFKGGIRSSEPNPFFLRHGRNIELKKGHYTLITQLISPFFIGHPEPVIHELADYQQSIKTGNFITLICQGIFFSLGIYYFALSVFRRQFTELMYSLFLILNMIQSATVLLVSSDVLKIYHFYLISSPLLISNVIYIVFIMNLLQLKPTTSPKLYNLGWVCIFALTFALAIAWYVPNWSLEAARYGVVIFTSYGLISAIIKSFKKDATALRYLIAIGAFFVLAIISISLKSIQNATIFIEHIGGIAVAIEAILLALVLSYQFAQLRIKSERDERSLKQSNKMAFHDELTKLPNRRAFFRDIKNLTPVSCLSIIDLDDLKLYNDTKGHQHGDYLLIEFSNALQNAISNDKTLYRLGGDEFAVICKQGNSSEINFHLKEAIQHLKSEKFPSISASIGSALSTEADDITQLIHLADSRMYKNKQQNQKIRGDI